VEGGVHPGVDGAVHQQPRRERAHLVLGVGFRVWGLGFRFEGFGFRVEGFGFRVEG